MHFCLPSASYGPQISQWGRSRSKTAVASFNEAKSALSFAGAQPSYVKLCLFLHPESNYPKASLKGHGCRQTGKIKKEVTRHWLCNISLLVKGGFTQPVYNCAGSSVLFPSVLGVTHSGLNLRISLFQFCFLINFLSRVLSWHRRIPFLSSL